MADDDARYPPTRDRHRRSRSADEEALYRRDDRRRPQYYEEEARQVAVQDGGRRVERELVVYRGERRRREPAPREQLVAYDSRHRQVASHSHPRSRGGDDREDKRSREDGGRRTTTCSDHRGKEEDGGFLSRHFDSSYDGLIAALAGAALGGMTVNGFTAPRKGDAGRRLKIAGGAIAGALAFNAGENKWREYIGEEEEEKAKEGKEKKTEGREGRERG